MVTHDSILWVVIISWLLAEIFGISNIEFIWETQKIFYNFIYWSSRVLLSSSVCLLKVKLFFLHFAEYQTFMIFLNIMELEEFSITIEKHVVEHNLRYKWQNILLYPFSSALNLVNVEFPSVFISLSPFDIPSLILFERRNTFNLQISTVVEDKTKGLSFLVMFF